LAATFAFEESAMSAAGPFGLIVREPVGVAGAIIPWNAPMSLINNKVAPALLAGCTVVVVLKSAPEAPGEGYMIAEAAQAVGLPPGVLNVVIADREVCELLVRGPRVDKITSTGSTAVGRRIASICGDRIARCTLELGGKSAAVILHDADIETAARTLSRAQCFLPGQVCSALTRIVVPRRRHDELLDALAGAFSQVRVGDRNRDPHEGHVQHVPQPRCPCPQSSLGHLPQRCPRHAHPRLHAAPPPRSGRSLRHRPSPAVSDGFCPRSSRRW
jgi:acyl-CoA reductase-like NAD-dependent aldehyde dehydrogenase